MGRNARHIFALSRKNLINWTRTWFGSFLEIAVPIACMVGICLMRRYSDVRLTQSQSMLDQAHAFFPVTELIGINWKNKANITSDTWDFLNFANITKSKQDQLRANPLYFFPPQCYDFKSVDDNGNPLLGISKEKSGARNSTGIGFIKNGNRVENAFLDQLQLLLARQHAEYPKIFHQYTIKQFEKVQMLDFYLAHQDYGFTADRPSLCFAFEIKKFSDTRYELHLHFNDQIITDPSGSGIPRQSIAPVDRISNVPDEVAYKKYMRSGYAHVQNWVANTILQQVTSPTAQIQMVTVPCQSVAFASDAVMRQILNQYLPMFTLLSYIMPVFRLCYRMVSEKETRVKESMQMMGLSEWAFWTSWFIYYLILNTIISTSCTFVLYKWLLNHTPFLTLWLYFFIFGISLFGFTVFCQAFFQRARNASIFTAIFYISTFFVSILVQGPEVPGVKKYYASMVPTVIVSLLTTPLAEFESVGMRLEGERLNEDFRNYKFMNGLRILLIDFAVYTLIGIYIDNIAPRKTGMQKPWTFICEMITPSYWDCFNLCRRQKLQQRELERKIKHFNAKSQYKSYKAMKAALRNREIETNFETKYIEVKNFEPPDISLNEMEKQRKYLRVQDLVKQYPNGFKAVNGVNVRMYEGQIFALLGHNGAGKTTIISMLSGMLKPTEGFANVYGYDVFEQDIDEVRHIMGVCPQHDILFDLLTPYEHLQIFQVFKGTKKTSEQSRAEIEKILKDVGIWDMKDTKAKNLSGGSRRKLSVAIALCGDSKFIMMDEPTSGMDLQARRSLWNMLKAYRTGRIIVLTTHYMDEADVLGDRIGIMDQGKIVCLGTSLFLKKRFGVGYNLTLVKSDKKRKADDVMDYLQSQLGPDIKMLSEISTEMHIQIPVDYAPKFKHFFTEFDQKLDGFDLEGYGISITTLEEVFLRVGHGHEQLSDYIEHKNRLRRQIEGIRESVEDPERTNLLNGEKPTDELGSALDNKVLDEYSISEKHEGGCWQNLVAMMMKRCILFRRQFSFLLLEAFVPVLFVLIGLLILQVSLLFNSPSRSIETKMYPLPQQILMNAEPIIRNVTQYDSSVNLTALNLTDLDWIDNSTLPIIKNMPTSYSLKTPEDFIVRERNYTYDWLYGQSLKKQDPKSPGFDLYQFFDQDIYNMRNLNESQWYNGGGYLVYQANITSNQYKVINYVNITSQDIAAAWPQFMYESILRTATGKPDFQFKLVTNPYPVLQKYKDAERKTSVASLLFVLAIGFSILPAAIVGHIMSEREQKMKHMQVISGMNLFSYWTINVLFDIFKMEIPMMMCVGLLYAFQLKEYYLSMYVFFLFPVGVVPFTHALSFFFQSEWGAQLFTIVINLVGLMFLPIGIFFMQMYSKTAFTADTLSYWGRLIPSFNVAKVVLFCGTAKEVHRERAVALEPFPPVDLDIWSMKNMKGDIYALGAHFGAGIILIIFFEVVVYQSCWIKIIYRVFECCFRTQHKGQGQKIFEELKHIDSDVMKEEERVMATSPKDMQVRVAQLRKVFKTGLLSNTVAVHNASFGLDFGDCFALLGVNGAGKTTCFKSLTNEYVPTSGQITVGGYSIINQFDKVRRMIGYCPQHNQLFESLTVRENLVFFARVKGVSSQLRTKLVNRTIEVMNLGEHAEKEVGNLSGGNKRKLQVAIAIIGSPQIVLLDEPSAGMDPEARRFMWSVVAGISQKRKKCAVVLTTHSMEEAEALSSKMGIMVKGGVFKCFGSVQHIKNKFGTGYELEVKIKPISKKQLLELAKRFSLERDQTRMTIEQVKQLLTETNVDKVIIDQITLGGLGDALVMEAESNKQTQVRTAHMLEWIHVIERGVKVIAALAKQFGKVEVLEHFSNYFKLRVLRQDKTIGFVFGMIEDLKKEVDIQEYSASQTTLEQIFAMFANMALDNSTNHVIFRYDPTSPLEIQPEEKTQYSGPLVSNPHLHEESPAKQQPTPNDDENPN